MDVVLKRRVECVEKHVMMMQESRKEILRKAGIMYVMCGVKKKVSKKIRFAEDEEEQGEEDGENGCTMGGIRRS